MKYLYRVAVASGLDYECMGDAALDLHRDDRVIVRCDRYQDYARVVGCLAAQPIDVSELERNRAEQARGRHVEGQHTPEIIRRATPQDDIHAAENDERSRTMHSRARECITFHRLEMKLIETHCSFDRRLAVFQFSAEGRVDFRELLRDLSQEFHMRVELRQVGVRDEASIQGGIGPCGRAFCCCTFLKRFNSINVKMAKIQGLSLNPANISGACGRLKCCLGYEVEHYRELYDAAKARAKAEAAGGGRAPGGSGSEDNGADRCRDDRAAAGGAPDSDDSEGAPDAAAPVAAAPATASAASAAASSPASTPGGAQG
jgi:cell fate regulator YaaT (PSP1 superfamily)